MTETEKAQFIEMNLMIAKRLEIKGIVQGVGFRPFVFRLAIQHGLTGEVANTSAGVSVRIEGQSMQIEAFCADIVRKKPPLAHITEISEYPETVNGFDNFSITESKTGRGRSTLISPDVSICDECLKEMSDPENRRYRYPFINCTDCGPRYSIISDIPYDRPDTTMRHFKMCRQCQSEYDNPGNRRFHAQPNACEVCGPRVFLCDNTRTGIQTDQPVEKAAELLRQGYILAVKGLGGFHLAADAENHEAVVRLRKRKHREEKPFALMSHSIALICCYAHIRPAEESLLLSHQRPIVILRKKEPNCLSDAVSPRNRYFGVMLPYTPLHYLLLGQNRFMALVMTSGNRSEEPIVSDNEEAFSRLSGIADYFLIHNRDIFVRSDDSIVRSEEAETSNTIRFIRRSRGYVPMPIFLKRAYPQILACGAEMKNTVCLTKGNQAFLSQHIGDLQHSETYSFFTQTISHIRRILDIHPQVIAYDLHPDYLSTRYAQEQQNMRQIPVQHHHAHIMSCMAENQAQTPVIGLAFDGTGYGTDGNLWGGEVLLAETEQFRRIAHLSYIPMPGGTAAIKEPWRMAISYLYSTFGDEMWNLNLPVLKEIEEKKIKFLIEMIRKKIASPLTSSMGRLFDGIAGIMGIRSHVSFEGQAAAELEMLADENTDSVYDYEQISGDIRIIPFQPIIRGVTEDMQKRISLPEISTKFHNTLIRLFSELCEIAGKENGVKQAALSGGVFQNPILSSGLTQALEQKGFQVFTHTRVPPNDGGISLGQALIAAGKVENEE